MNTGRKERRKGVREGRTIQQNWKEVERERDSTWLLNNWGVSRKREWLREVSSFSDPFTTIRNKVRGANVRKRRQVRTY